MQSLSGFIENLNYFLWVLASDRFGSKIFDLGWVGSIFCGSGRVSLVWVWISKISPKNVKFFNIFPFRSKKIASGRVEAGSASYWLRVKSKLGSGQGPSLVLAVIICLKWKLGWSLNSIPWIRGMHCICILSAVNTFLEQWVLFQKIFKSQICTDRKTQYCVQRPQGTSCFWGLRFWVENRAFQYWLKVCLIQGLPYTHSYHFLFHQFKVCLAILHSL